MKRWNIKWYLALGILFTIILATGTALADKPGWKNGGKEGKGKHQETYHDENQTGNHNDGDSQHHDKTHVFFKDEQRAFIQDYYADRYQRGHCPPGLAKKQNGCMPPGQAKKWSVGRPLPRDVIFHDLPPRVLEQLGPPPPHHRFVRVAQDILLIAVGTGMVIDAIEDLNWEFGHR
jgi:Ni/Co efflux regulator RcnB